ncbi:MAG: aliphatic sulfonate import ATP-binding protein SsuB [Pseudomonadota bacterium]|jgi:sulfonate transport system ATP-binding protein
MTLTLKLPSTSEAPSAPQSAPRTLQRGRPVPEHGLSVDLAGLGKSYGARRILGEAEAGLDLRIAPGEFVAIVGRSGCGKSTLLRLVAGLETADTGRLALGGDTGAAARADLRIMFQDARLLPWKRVIDNVRLGLDGEAGRARAAEALAQVGLADRGGDWPAVLSGGQRQRVALARDCCCSTSRWARSTR